MFVDANVFVSKTISDWIYLLKETNSGAFRCVTSVDVMVEALAAGRHKLPKAPGGWTIHKLSQFVEIADDVMRDFSGKEPFDGADEGDYHVHAAVLASGAGILVTANDPRDFGTVPYEVVHPDALLVRMVTQWGLAVDVALKLQRAYWKGAPKSLGQALVDAGCPQFAAVIGR